MANEVLVLGGGLAGLAAADALVGRGFQVTVVEFRGSMGGKAKSWVNAAGDDIEHGFHFFPNWYANTLELMNRLGVSGSLVPHDGYRMVNTDNRGGLMTFGCYPLPAFNIFTPENALFPDASPLDKLTYLAAMVKMVSYNDRRIEDLDRVSVTDWARAQWFMTRGAIDKLIDAYRPIPSGNWETSAMTGMRIIDSFSRKNCPFCYVLDGPPNPVFINPWVADLTARGVVFQPRHTVRKLLLTPLGSSWRIDGVEVEPRGSAPITMTADHYVCALPAPPLIEILEQSDHHVMSTDYFRGIASLRFRAMMASQIWFNRKLTSEKRHFLYRDSLLTAFIDQSNNWSSLDPTKSVIAVDYTFAEPLLAMSDDDIISLTFDEMNRLGHGTPLATPVGWGDLDTSKFGGKGYHLNRNDDDPLLANGVGEWRYRPAQRSPIAKLMLAGDFTRTWTNLTCMEGAIESGMRAANEILADRALPPVPIARRTPPPLFRLLKTAYQAYWTLGGRFGGWRI